VAQSDALPRGYDRGRFTARPRPNGRPREVASGEQRAPENAGWEGVLYIPAGVSAAAERPAPLLLTLHGATSRGERMIARWRDAAESAGLVLLAPDSVQRTWDVLTGGYGPDVARIDAALNTVFTLLRIDPRRCFIGGFSDGASYALSLGIANGDLFPAIVANSPGFCMPACRVGVPRVLITHGTQDKILPFDVTGSRLAVQLEQAGYPVTFHSYDDGHVMTPEVLAWSLAFMGLDAG
jgi:predicted esterase